MERERKGEGERDRWGGMDKEGDGERVTKDGGGGREIEGDGERGTKDGERGRERWGRENGKKCKTYFKKVRGSFRLF